MYPSNLKTVIDLIARTKEERLRLSLEHGELYIKYPKGSPVNPELIKELKTHKSLLMEYLRKDNKTMDDPAHAEMAINSIEFDGRTYHRITPSLRYWVNDKADKKYKELDGAYGACISSWIVKGALDINVLDKAVEWLVKRHESLRSVFHNICGEWLLGIEQWNASLYRMETIYVEEGAEHEEEVEKLSKFHGHRFDLTKGPLFVARLIVAGPTHFILSFKIHHSIIDAWSEEILLRDLLIAYRSLLAGNVPSLPALPFHLKEYLALINRDIRQNYDSHKLYWTTRCTTLPAEVIVPETKAGRTSMEEKKCLVELFEFPRVLVEKLSLLAGEFSVNLFLILQAGFKYYLLQKTGCKDIMIGTYILGRDHPGIEDQIGCYARSVFIRTVLEGNESFHQVIAKVKTANEDMHTYTAYRLLDAITELLTAGQSIYGTFWKFNLQFVDQQKVYLRQDGAAIGTPEQGLVIKRKIQAGNSYIPIDMQLTFLYFLKDVRLSVEYDSSLYTPAQLSAFINEYIACLHRITNS